MKKFLFVLSLIGLFTFWSPNVNAADDDPCYTIILACPDGTLHYVVVCNNEDWRAWGELICGMVYH